MNPTSSGFITSRNSRNVVTSSIEAPVDVDPGRKVRLGAERQNHAKLIAVEFVRVVALLDAV